MQNLHEEDPAQRWSRKTKRAHMPAFEYGGFPYVNNRELVCLHLLCVNQAEN